MKKFFAFLTVLSMLLSAAAVAVAATGESVSQGSIRSAAIVELSAPAEVYQGRDVSSSIVLKFSLEGETGVPLAPGDSISLSTNIGELFSSTNESGSWPLGPYEVKDQDGNVAVSVSIFEDRLSFTLLDGVSDTVEKIEGELNLFLLKAKNVGAAIGKPVEKELKAGDKSCAILFKEPVPSSTEGSVDIDTSWKNGWSIVNKQDGTKPGATISIEVNPIGSMDLYGYTGPDDDRVPKAYDQFLISDAIPEKGFVDIGTVQIYAAIPTLAQAAKDMTFNTWYQVKQGEYYAQRYGTQRFLLNSDGGKMTRLVQNDGETLDQFKARVSEKALQWGVYCDSEMNETFFCNFGGIGKKDDNNGIYYKNYWYGKNYIDAGYGSIFGDEGPTGGNIVSYYIEFNTYYPDIDGTKDVTNYGKRECLISGDSAVKVGGNSATYQIANGQNPGVARKNSLSFRLVDDEDRSMPLAGGVFELEELKDGEWVSTGFNITTDENGKGRFAPFKPGTYRIRQTTWLDGYDVTVSKFEPATSIGNQLDEHGVFVVTGNEQLGFSVLVTNVKQPDPGPGPDPDPEPAPDPNPAPDPDPEPAPDPDPEPAPDPDPEPAPDPDPEPAPDPDPEPTPDPDPSPDPNPDTDSDGGADSAPDSNPPSDGNGSNEQSDGDDSGVSDAPSGLPQTGDINWTVCAAGVVLLGAALLATGVYISHQNRVRQ